MTNFLSSIEWCGQTPQKKNKAAAHIALNHWYVISGSTGEMNGYPDVHSTNHVEYLLINVKYVLKLAINTINLRNKLRFFINPKRNAEIKNQIPLVRAK
jgi:hypothetical protein